MKFKIFISITIVGIICSCSSDLDTGDVSRLTSFPIITQTGSPEILVPLNTEFIDPGASAVAGSVSVEVQATYASGTYQGATGINTSVPDNYLVTYSAENSDGFDGTSIRSVWVANTGDLTTSIEGLYLSDVQRAPDFVPSAQYDDLKYVLIWKTGDNTYEISHAVGGYYDFGRAYGAGYAARGAEITVNDLATNDFTITQAVFPIWGNVADITEFTVDAANKMITYTGTGNFGNGAFKVQLKQVQF